MPDFLRDARFGLRLLLKNPGFAAVAVLALALGIGANTAIFSVVYATLLAPLPYPEPDQLVMVWSKIQENRNVTAAADFLDWKRQSTVFQDLNAWIGRSVNLATGERPEQVQAATTTPGFAAMIGYNLFLGRDFVPEEGTPGKDQVVILTHQFWRERFGADRAIVGRQIRIDGKPFTVVGVNMGFQTDHLLTFSLPVPQGRLDGNEQVNAFYRQLLDRITSVPGVSAASVLTGMAVYGTGFGMPFYIAGKPVDDPSKRPGAGFNMVTPDYYRTFGIPIARGRAFTEQDRANGVHVAIVNETFVKRYFPGDDPLTQRIVVEQLIPGATKLGPGVEWQIVGVYNNVRNGGPKGDGFPEIDVPFWQSPWPRAQLAVRTAGDPASLHQSLAAVIRSVDPDLPMADVKTMDQVIDESVAGDRFGTALFGSFAGVALLLAAVGIYGVMSFVVAQRTHEIGLRMALGAGRRAVLLQVLKEGMATALAGIALGSIGAYLVGRAMQGMVYNVGPLDPVAFGTVAITLLASAVVACLVPARRAASVDPMVALRQD